MRIPWTTVVVSFIIVLIAASQLNIGKLADALWRVDPAYLGAAMLIWIIMVLLKVVKWMAVIRAIDGRVTPKESLIALMVGIFIGIMTPGRIGDFVRAAYVKDRLSWGKGVLAVVIDRAMDVLLLIGFAAAGVVWLSMISGFKVISIEVVAGVGILALSATYLALKKSFMKKFILPIAKRLLPAPFFVMVEKLGKQFFEAIPLLKKNMHFIFGAVIASVLTWLLSITFGFILMLGVGMHVEWKLALLTVPMLALVEILPVSVIGIGTRELAAILILSFFGISPEQAVIFSLLYFVLGYLPSVVIGFILFNTNPIPLEGGLQGVMNRFSLSKKP